MAKRRVAGGGGGSRRGRIAALLLAFVAVAFIVNFRRTWVLQRNVEIAELQREQRKLEADRDRLIVEIRAASSRAVLLPIAEERLGLRISPTQIIDLPRGEAPKAPGGPP